MWKEKPPKSVLFASLKCSWDRHKLAHSCCEAHEATEHGDKIFCDRPHLQACGYVYFHSSTG